jgi:DNA-binding MarR family transcriptional regulator
MSQFAYCPTITNLARLIHKRTSENLEWLGLGSGQLAVLRTIREAPGIHQVTIAQRLGVNKSVVSRAVKALTRAGYITRAHPDSGLRGLVPSRQDLLLGRRQEKCVREIEDLLRKGFSAEELEVFEDFLQRATRRLGAAPTDPVAELLRSSAHAGLHRELGIMDF